MITPRITEAQFVEITRTLSRLRAGISFSADLIPEILIAGENAAIAGNSIQEAMAKAVANLAFRKKKQRVQA